MRLREVVYGLTVAIMTVFLVGCEGSIDEPMDEVPSSIDGFSINLNQGNLKVQSSVDTTSTNNNLIHTVAMPSQSRLSDDDVQHAAIITVKFLNNLMKKNAGFKLKVIKGRNSQFKLAALYKKKVKKTWLCTATQKKASKKIDVTCSS
ncbi:MAG TPA: hypothetical protein DCL40_05895 [Coxiellaceae bacterium]|nr:hypothetical protein [Coxiellaceae bacterium]